MSRSHSIKNLIIVRQLRRVVVLILNPHSHDNNGSKSYKSNNHSNSNKKNSGSKGHSNHRGGGDSFFGGDPFF
jgi:hypothetical protein